MQWNGQCWLGRLRGRGVFAVFVTITLHCTAWHCTAIYRTAHFCTGLCTAYYCTVQYITHGCGRPQFIRETTMSPDTLALCSTALYFTLLYCTEIHCTVLHCHESELHCTALQCNVFQRTAQCTEQWVLTLGTGWLGSPTLYLIVWSSILPPPQFSARAVSSPLCCTTVQHTMTTSLPLQGPHVHKVWLVGTEADMSHRRPCKL